MLCIKRLFLSYLVFCLLCIGTVSSAVAATATDLSTRIPQQRPKVGLVLGGGGASGMAHVGVIKVLEELGIPIDVIAGTSMGAIVGSFYAAGYSSAEMEKIVKTLDWADLFRDGQAREQQAFQQKQENAGFFNTFEVGVKKGAVQLPEGLISGQKLMFELRHLLSRVSQVDDFDRLPIPFRAVATDIETGKMVVLDHGNLATAVRASMSIPGLFAPVTIDNQVLVDGFVSNNVPVDVARAMGADILIVVSIPYYFEKRDQLDSAVTVSFQAMQFLTSKNSLPQLRDVKSPSVVLEPDVKDIGSLDFDRVGETIPVGEAAARKQVAALKHIVALTQGYDQPPQRPKAPKVLTDQGRILSVTINNDSKLSDSVILERLNVQAGDPLDLDRLQQDLESLHSLGYFDLVDYHLKPVEGEGYDLEIIAHRRSTGDNRLRLGFSLEDNFEGDTGYQLGLSYNRKGITQAGGEWRNRLVIGDTLHFDSELYQPLDPKQGSFFNTRVWHDRQDFYEYNNEQRTAEVRVAETGIQFDRGQDIGTTGEWRGGWFYRRLMPTLKTGVAEQPIPDSVTLSGLQLNYQYDTLDDADFPKRGRWLEADYTHGFAMLGADHTFDRLKITAGKAWTSGAHRVVAHAELGTTFDDDTFISERLALGGRGRLSGLEDNQLRGNYAALAGIEYNRELTTIPRLARVYAGASVETGNAWPTREAVSWGNLLVSGSLYLGLDSKIGPAYLGIGQTEGYDPRVFLQVGRDF